MDNEQSSDLRDDQAKLDTDSSPSQAPLTTYPLEAPTAPHSWSTSAVYSPQAPTWGAPAAYNYPSPSPNWGAPTAYSSAAPAWGAQAAYNYPSPGYPSPAPAWGAQAPYSAVPPIQPSQRVEKDELDITLKILKKAINVNPSNTREVGITQLELINRYHRIALQQANRSFRWALVAAGIGLLFFIVAVGSLILKQPASVSYTSLISGGLVEVISAINFNLYGRATNQLASFHSYVDRTHRFLIANSLCGNLADAKVRDETRSDLVRKIMDTAPKDALVVKPSTEENLHTADESV